MKTSTCNKKLAAHVCLALSLLMSAATQAAKPEGAGQGKGGGKGGGGDDGGTSEPIDAEICSTVLTTSCLVGSQDGFQKGEPEVPSVGSEFPPGCSVLELAEPTDTFTLPTGYQLVFEDDFAEPPSNADYSNTVDYTRWSTKYPFAIDAKFNTIPGEDQHWNVNTTGRYPGEGLDLTNFYNNQSQIDFIDALFDISHVDMNDTDNRDMAPVFALNNDGMLDITAYRNPEDQQIRRINKAKPFLSGLISSHANPDPDNNVAAHGFEFRYGYFESQVVLPENGNGFRAALWLYSDNAYYNEQLRDHPELFVPNDNRHEIDVMEYLPNTQIGESPCWLPQESLFGGNVTNSTRAPEHQVLTYDTIFHTYHYDNASKRTPNNWTFNGESHYTDRRDFAFSGNPASAAPFAFQAGQTIKFGLLWEHNLIEWYVNDVLVHRVVEENGRDEEIPGFQHVANVFDKRMYIMANLAMGLDVFEGEEIDQSVFDDADGRGPTFGIDYIRVYQDATNGNHEWCGRGLNSSLKCDGMIGNTPLPLP